VVGREAHAAGIVRDVGHAQRLPLPDEDALQAMAAWQGTDLRTLSGRDTRSDEVGEVAVGPGNAERPIARARDAWRSTMRYST
jgi:hypothetical protein